MSDSLPILECEPYLFLELRISDRLSLCNPTAIIDVSFQFLMHVTVVCKVMHQLLSVNADLTKFISCCALIVHALMFGQTSIIVLAS